MAFRKEPKKYPLHIKPVSKKEILQSGLSKLKKKPKFKKINPHTLKREELISLIDQIRFYNKPSEILLGFKLNASELYTKGIFLKDLIKVLPLEDLSHLGYNFESILSLALKEGYTISEIVDVGIKLNKVNDVANVLFKQNISPEEIIKIMREHHCLPGDIIDAVIDLPGVTDIVILKGMLSSKNVNMLYIVNAMVDHGIPIENIVRNLNILKVPISDIIKTLNVMHYNVPSIIKMCIKDSGIDINKTAKGLIAVKFNLLDINKGFIENNVTLPKIAKAILDANIRPSKETTALLKCGIDPYTVASAMFKAGASVDDVALGLINANVPGNKVRDIIIATKRSK